MVTKMSKVIERKILLTTLNDDKLTLKKFEYTKAIDTIVTDCWQMKNSSRKIIPLKLCYDVYIRHRYHKRIIKEIKKNII